MRHFILAALLTTVAAVPAFADPMTVGERQRLVAHLEMTEAWADSETLGLSEAQLKFKTTPDSWSVEEVMMHLAIAEPQHWQSFKESLAKPVQPDFKPQATDAGTTDHDAWNALVRHRSYPAHHHRRSPRAAWPVPHLQGRARLVQEAARGDDEGGEGDSGGPARAAVPDRQPGFVSVVPDDLHPLAAAHHADQGSKGAQGLSKAISKNQDA